MTEVRMPEPDTHFFDTDTGLDVWSHSKTQLKQYGDDRAREALEIAADTCDSTMYIDGDGTVSKYGPMTYANVEIKQCADAIRALTKEIK